MANELDLFDLGTELNEKYRILSVRAPIRMGIKAYGWFYSEFVPSYRARDTSEAERALELVYQFIEQVKDKYKVDAKNIYLLGFSQGAILSLATAMYRPEIIGGVVCLSGCLLPNFSQRIPSENVKDFPVFMSHGTKDDVLPVQYAREAQIALDALSLDLTYFEHSIAHDVVDANFHPARDWLLSRPYCG